MLATTHVLTGALIGRIVRRPVAAFAVGVVSHLALDACPHWGMDMNAAGARGRYLLIAATDGLTLSMALLWVAKRYGVGSELAGSLGALALDMDKPAAELGVVQLWPDRVHRTHIGIQTGERPHRWPIDVTVGLVSAALLSRGARSRPGAAAS